MFAKMSIFCFAVIGMFAILFALLPSGFFYTSYEASAGAEKEVGSYFALANVTAYDLMGQDNMTFEYSSLDHHPEAPQFFITTDQYLEVWWGWDFETLTPIELRHVDIGWFGIRWPHQLKMRGKDKTLLSFYAGYYGWRSDAIVENLTNAEGTFNHLTDNWDSNAQASIFYGSCEHLAVSLLISYNQSAYDNINQAYLDEKLLYRITYEINWNATSVNAFHVLANIVTFQNPNLGIDDSTVNTILCASIALPIWVMTAIMLVIIVQSVIPFIKGIQAGS